MLPQQAGGLKQHYADQNDGIDQHAVLGEATQQLRKERQHNRRHDGTRNRAHAAQNHHNQDLHRIVEVKLARVQNTDMMCIEATGDPGEERRQDKREQLIVGSMDSGRFCRNFIFPDGNDRTSMAGMNKGKDHRNGYNGDDKHICEGCQKWDAGQARCAAGKRHGQDQHTDDFAESQRQNGQVVALQTKCRHADDDAEGRRHNAADQQRQRETNHCGQSGIHGEQRRRIRAHTHETCMSQNQLAQKAGGQIQANSQNHIDADHGQNAGVIGIDNIRTD